MDERLIHLYVAVASLFSLVCRGIWSSNLLRKTRDSSTPTGFARANAVSASIGDGGRGREFILLKTSRLCSVSAVTCLTVYVFGNQARCPADIALVATLVSGLQFSHYVF